MKDLLKLLFPYRAHLENEIEYLRAQLAQKQRRIDEGDQRWADFTKALQRKDRSPAPALHAVKPKGWEAYRAAKRDEPETEPDAGSEVAAAGNGI